MNPAEHSRGRIVVRPFVVGDAPQLYEAVDESRRELGEWLDWCRDRYTSANAVDWIERSLTSEVLRDTRNFGVFANSSDMALIGCVGVSKIDWVASTGNLGYWVRTRCVGNGYATEAAGFMAYYARTQLALTRVEIAVHLHNLRSAGVARALGATDEGVFPARIVHRGELVEARVFSLARTARGPAENDPK